MNDSKIMQFNNQYIPRSKKIMSQGENKTIDNSELPKSPLSDNAIKKNLLKSIKNVAHIVPDMTTARFDLLSRVKKHVEQQRSNSPQNKSPGFSNAKPKNAQININNDEDNFSLITNKCISTSPKHHLIKGMDDKKLTSFNKGQAIKNNSRIITDASILDQTGVKLKSVPHQKFIAVEGSIVSLIEFTFKNKLKNSQNDKAPSLSSPKTQEKPDRFKIDQINSKRPKIISPPIQLFNYPLTPTIMKRPNDINNNTNTLNSKQIKVLLLPDMSSLSRSSITKNRLNRPQMSPLFDRVSVSRTQNRANDSESSPQSPNKLINLTKNLKKKILNNKVTSITDYSPKNLNLSFDSPTRNSPIKNTNSPYSHDKTFNFDKKSDIMDNKNHDIVDNLFQDVNKEESVQKKIEWKKGKIHSKRITLKDIFAFPTSPSNSQRKKELTIIPDIHQKTPSVIDRYFNNYTNDQSKVFLTSGHRDENNPFKSKFDFNDELEITKKNDNSDEEGQKLINLLQFPNETPKPFSPVSKENSYKIKPKPNIIYVPQTNVLTTDGVVDKIDLISLPIQVSEDSKLKIDNVFKTCFIKTIVTPDKKSVTLNHQKRFKSAQRYTKTDTKILALNI